MKRTAIFCTFLLAATIGFSQFKNDNVLYKTVYPQDLCSGLQQSKDYLLLDVRSPGEYADTSSSAGYNLGHFQHAVNINVRELGPRLAEIASYKNKTIYVYCSHSQRSRRASKMLADSGFTKVININGGVTALRQLPAENCVNSFIKSNVGYSILGPQDLCKKLSTNNKNIFLLDVRSDSAFRHISSEANVNALGTLKNSINIPLESLPKRLAEIPQGKEIIIMDLFGDDAAKAAIILRDNNYKNISMLLEGVDRINYTNSEEIPCMQSQFISNAKYKIISSSDFKKFAAKYPGYAVLDIRTEEEFQNKHKDYFRNIGHLERAKNIPAQQLISGTATISNKKNEPILLYTFSGNKEVHEVALMLIKQGYTNVNVLAGGLFNIRWTAGNVKGCASLNDLVVDVPIDNL